MTGVRQCQPTIVTAKGCVVKYAVLLSEEVRHDQPTKARPMRRSYCHMPWLTRLVVLVGRYCAATFWFRVVDFWFIAFLLCLFKFGGLI